MAKQPTTDPSAGERTPLALLALAQTNNTTNHETGYALAAQAYDLLERDDPNNTKLKAHTLAQMAIRGALAGHKPSETNTQLQLSHALLTKNPNDQPRELAIGAVARIRVTALRLFLGKDVEEAGLEQARSWQQEAMAALRPPSTTPRSRKTDRLWTMMMRHAALMEALAGNLEEARRLGTLALHYARTAEKEGDGLDDLKAARQFRKEQADKVRRLLDWLNRRTDADWTQHTHEEYKLVLELLGNPNLMRKP